MNQVEIKNLNEPKECKDIYEVLSFPLVFEVIMKKIFPEIKKEYKKQGERINFLKNEENLTKTVKYFQKKGNVEEFVKALEKKRKEKKKVLERWGLTDKQVNSYVLAIHTLKRFKNW